MTNTPELAQTFEDLVSIAHGPGSADDLLDSLGALRLLELSIEQARRKTVRAARADGATWQDIGDAIGVTKQAAQQAYGV